MGNLLKRDSIMKYLFDICHPAHVHLFRNYIKVLKNEGHEVCVVSREKDITTELLDAYGIKHIVVSKAGVSFFSKLGELITRTSKILKLNRKEQFDIACGTSVSIGLMSLFSKTKSYVFNEDDDTTVPLFCLLAYPFATKIVNPKCIKYKRWQKKRLRHDSCHELAYLHPDNFIPNKKVLKRYGLKKREYVVFRFSALQAHHDLNAAGISEDLFAKIASMLKGLQIVISSETGKENKYDVIAHIAPEDMHSVLYFAKFAVADSQTMAVEAAVLGLPVIRINTFKGKSSLLQEIEDKYKLAYSYIPQEKAEIILTLRKLLDDKGLSRKWSRRQKIFLKEKKNFNEWIEDEITS